jgi:SAM-dependent methyltransferase
MLRNLVNRYDFVRAGRVLARSDASARIAGLFGRDTTRVRRKWDEIELEPGQWWVIEDVTRRWAEKVSGDPEVDFRHHVIRQHLGDRRGLIGCSPGCGTGEREMAWAATGIFERFDAFDLSPVRIAAAREEAARRDLDHVLNFEVADVSSARLGFASYDVIVAEHSLHHFSPLREVMLAIRDAIAPDGWFFVDEFVGPTRFQWTYRQLEAANGLLRTLPERYRRTPRGLKRTVIRPSILSMYLDDPSEAIESADIMPLLHELFDVIDERGYGGSVLQLAFTDISRNFLDRDEETTEVLRYCFDVEDALLRSGDVAHDFMIAACRRPGDEPSQQPMVNGRSGAVLAG